MISAKDILGAINGIAATSSRTEKEHMVGELIQDELALELLKLTYDPFITFGITPPDVAGTGTMELKLDSPQPWIMLHQLAKRELTGNAAATAVKRMLEDMESSSSQLLRRVLMKDMRAGFTDGTINRVRPGTIKVFEVMLSKPYEEKRIKSFPVAVEPKLDGLRATGLVADGGAKFYSRVGNHFPALDHLSDAVWEMIERAVIVLQTDQSIGDPKCVETYIQMLGGINNPKVVIDAEAITGSFNKSVGDLRRDNEDAEDVVLNVFDAIPYDLFAAADRQIKIPFRVRRLFTELLVRCAPKDAPIVVTPLIHARSHEEIQAIYRDHRVAGLEGAMVKLLDAPYEKKKGFYWMKIKPHETIEMRIEDVYEGEGKYVGMLGGVIGTIDGVKVRVGSGFTDDERKELWVNRPNGRLSEVEFHERTPDGNLRHSRHVRFRDDKDEQLRSAA